MADRPASAARANLPRILAAVAAVAGLVVVLLVTGVVGGDDADAPKAPSPDQVAQELRGGKILAGTPRAPFAMRYTDDWVLLPASELRSGRGTAPLAGLRRKDRSGVATVTLRGPVQGGIGSLEKRLPAELAQRFDDFRLQTIRRLDVAAGPALYTSWTRSQTGRVQSQLVVPVSNRRSFTVDVVLNAGAQDAAAEIGVMLRTFDTAPAQ